MFFLIGAAIKPSCKTIVSFSYTESSIGLECLMLQYYSEYNMYMSYYSRHRLDGQNYHCSVLILIFSLQTIEKKKNARAAKVMNANNTSNVSGKKILSLEIMV